MTDPLWTEDGTAHNVEAALADALLWLRVLAGLLAKQPSIDMVQRNVNGNRLRMCIDQAASFLPNEVAAQIPANILQE